MDSRELASKSFHVILDVGLERFDVDADRGKGVENNLGLRVRPLPLGVLGCTLRRIVSRHFGNLHVGLKGFADLLEKV